MSLTRTSEPSGRPRTMIRPNSAGSVSRPAVTTGIVSWVPGGEGSRPMRPAGVEAQEHRELELADRLRVAHAGNAFELVLDVDLRVVAQVFGVETRVVRGERANHEDARLALLHRDAVAHHLLRQLRLGERDLVLHVHRCEVRVPRDVKIDRQVHDAGARVRRLEVEQAVEPRELLLDRRGNGSGDVLRGRARIHRLHLDLGRRERRIAVHRERAEREQPEQHDHDRDDAREDRAPDEDVADLRPVAHGVLRAAPLSAAGWYATARTGDPGATCWRPSTTTRSPAARPCAISHDPPSQAVAITGRVATLSPASSTYTNDPPSPCCTARCGTRIAPGCVSPRSRTRTNWPGSKRCCGFSSSARSS